MSKRAYDNSNRARQRSNTRAKIVQAMVDAMATGRDDISVAELAALSGVSLRTVYQHFPDKASRIAAINEWVEAAVDTDAVFPRDYADIGNYVERLVDYVLDNEAVVRAQMAPGISKSVRSLRKRAHARHLRRVLREHGVRPSEIERIVALIISTMRAEAIYDLRDIYRYRRAQIKADLRRMVELLLEDRQP